MLAYFKKEVIYLKRVSFGKINLDSSLDLGKYRELTCDELELLKEKYISVK